MYLFHPLGALWVVTVLFRGFLCDLYGPQEIYSKNVEGLSLIQIIVA
jgi:hypothetical protein